MADNIIQIKNLFKSFGSLKVLEDVSFDVRKGENLVVFGQSGTGKSVLLKCLIGLLKADRGEIFIKGEKVHEISDKNLNKLRKSMGFLFQGAALYDSMTVRENLEFPLVKHFDYSRKELDEKVLHTLDLVSLVEAVDKMPSELSGGMRKRIGLARSIITDPEIMLYDEPTTGLDPITSIDISELILSLQKKLNMTSIVVTHDLLCADIIADRAIFLNEGKIIFNGVLKELARSNDPFLNKFFNHQLTQA